MSNGKGVQQVVLISKYALYVAIEEGKVLNLRGKRGTWEELRVVRSMTDFLSQPLCLAHMETVCFER